MDGMSMTAIRRHIPDLPRLEREACRLGAADRWLTYRAWHQEIKPAIEQCVGFGALSAPPDLRTPAAYDDVTRHLLAIYETAAERSQEQTA